MTFLFDYLMVIYGVEIAKYLWFTWQLLNILQENTLVENIVVDLDIVYIVTIINISVSSKAFRFWWKENWIWNFDNDNQHTNFEKFNLDPRASCRAKSKTAKEGIFWKNYENIHLAFEKISWKKLAFAPV